MMWKLFERRVVATIFLALVGAGCGGSARVVVRDEAGGLLSLSGDDGAARDDALRIIEAHCPHGHHLTLDGPVEVGEESHTTQRQGEAIALDQSRQTSGGIEPGSQTSLTVTEGGSVSTFDPASNAAPRERSVRTERRIEYECDEADE